MSIFKTETRRQYRSSHRCRKIQLAMTANVLSQIQLELKTAVKCLRCLEHGCNFS